MFHTDAAKVALGKELFYDTRLSKNNNQNCASCHELSDKGYGTDLAPTSTGSLGSLGVRNSPTVYNSVFNFTQFWDGRAAHLAEQAQGPVVNPIEMSMANWDEAAAKIKDDPKYQKQFSTLYNGEISMNTITDAIAEFEKTLITPNSPFDRWLKGDENALTEEQKLGYERFKQYGCIACHQGRNVGGNMYQKFGILKDITQNTQFPGLGKDLGRFDITGNDADKHFFRVPSLRLVVKTPPYFHDGSVNTLDEAVKIMIEYQLGREVPQQDVDAIIAFLHSLVGELPKGVTP
ncbi:cytochrome-c peroxidase [Suttonella ornithocola]|uniref:cytochrome-c peroxidase n=1 Tax=Suttonella ornithocola TaxID=279832 RepID=UPI000A6E30EC|nr:cytochrome-c peroxidase [Suttonella ornithocola]